MADDPPSSYRVLSTVGLVVVAFIVGSFTTFAEVFPFDPLLRPAFYAVDAFTEQVYERRKPRGQTASWRDARTSKTGVTLHREGEAFEGYTLYSYGGQSGAWLMDMSGEVVHRWEAPFHEVWEDPPHVDNPSPESMITWVDSHVFPNGDAIGLYTANSASPWGYGLVKVDVDSEVLWRAPIQAHHEFDVEPDGTIYTLSHRLGPAGDAAPHLRSKSSETTVLRDYLVILDSDGNVERRISILEAFIRADYPHLLRWPKITEAWDPLHANSVDVADREQASHHEFLDPGDVLLSMRSMSLLAVLDPESERIVWASRGPWFAQHDAQFIGDGLVSLYDNIGDTGPVGGTRILEYSIPRRKIVWTYSGTPEHPLWSKSRGHHDRLPNGNILITESRGGRLLEVTRQGRRVWEYYVPVREEVDGTERLPTVFAAERYPSDYPEFDVGG